MYFVIEESSWTHEPGNLDDAEQRTAYIERLELLLDRLDVADERDEGIAASHELLLQNIEGRALGDFLWSLPREVTQRLSARLMSVRFWDDDEPDFEFEATVDDEVTISPSLVYAHGRVRQGKTFACIPLPGHWEGPKVIIVSDRSEQVHFVVNEETHREFFRDALRRKKGDQAGVQELAPHAFPSTWFVDGVWRELRDFAGGYDRVREALIGFLSVFDDHGHWIFTDGTGRLSPTEPSGRSGIPITNQLIMQRFSGWGITVSPEKPNVAKDSHCRQARERSVGSRVLYCEWHLKIDPHENRVHFHEPVPESDDRPIVAIFCCHLPLPGD